MSDLRALLTETTSRVLGDAFSSGLRSFDQAHWQQIADIELHRVLISEAKGGAGASWEDAQGLLHALGFFASAQPLADAMLANRLLAKADFEVTDAPAGLSVTTTGRVQADANAWTFTGQCRSVALHPSTAHVVAVVDGDDQTFVLRLDPRAAVRIREGHNLAGDSRAALEFDRVPVEIRTVPGVTAATLFDDAALMRCALIDGALSATLERTVEYARTRKQFGKAIGQFQAVQQSLALFAEESAAVTAACNGAILARDRGSAEFEIACAKLRANEAVGACCAIAHQVHGAIGFTHEFDLRHFTQRLLSWRSECGGDHYWASRLGASVAQRGASNFWPDLTALSDAVGISLAQEQP